MKRNPTVVGFATRVLLATACVTGCAAEPGDETDANAESIAAPAAVSDVVRCGGRITTERKLQNDLNCDCTSAPALTVVGPGRLDLLGHTVSCRKGDEGDKPVIALLGAGARLSNGSVTHKGPDRPADCVQIKGNSHGVFAIKASSCNNCLRVVGNRNKVKDCDATGAQINGIYISGSDNQVVGNFVKGNIETGILASGKNNYVANNTVKEAEDGIYIVGASDGTKVIENQVKYSGISIRANGCQVIGNLSKESHNSGIWVRGSGNVLRKNTAKYGNPFDLEDASADCDKNTWEDNEYGTSAHSIGNGDYISDPACIE